MAPITTLKCACDSCLCIVDVTAAIDKEGQYYCSDACASGHPDGNRCAAAQSGCGCHH